MLSLTMLGKQEGYTESQSTTYTDYGYPFSTVPKVSYRIRPAYIIQPGNTQTINVKGSISDGPLNDFGERSCVHYALEGTAVWTPDIDRKVGPTPLWPYKNAAVRIQDQLFSCVLPLGSVWTMGPTRFYQRSLGYQSIFGVICHNKSNYYSYMAGDQTSDGSVINASLYVTAIDLKFSLKTSMKRRRLTFDNWDDFYSYKVDEKTLSVPLSVISMTKFSESYTDPSEIIARLHRYRVDAIKYMTITPEFSRRQVFGDLARDAVEKVKFVETNGLQFLMEMRSADNLFRSVAIKYATPRTLASAYLGGKYGIDSQLRDIESYLQGAKRYLLRGSLPYRVTKAASLYPIGTVGNAEYHYKIFFKTYDDTITKALTMLSEWSLLPSIEMAWDFIPFSFVFDWFTRFGDLLAVIDSRTAMQLYDVLSITRSEKITRWDVADDPMFPLDVNGDIRYTWYQRETSLEQLDQPQFSFHPPKQFNNGVELTALLVANARRR